MDKSTFLLGHNTQGRIICSDGDSYYNRRLRFFLEIRGRYFFYFDSLEKSSKSNYFHLERIEKVLKKDLMADEHREDDLNLLILEKLYTTLIMDDINSITVSDVFSIEDVDKYLNEYYFAESNI